MNDQIALIVGLGNPGTQYAHTRHNAGADLVEQLAAHLNSPLKPEPRFHGFTTKVNLNNLSVHLLIPSTFMNLSGQSVAALTNFYKIQANQILVAHDELDLQPGTARLKFSGGHGGHNGLRDIISRLGNTKDFYRLRIGIGHPGHSSQVSGYVLTKAPKAEQLQTQAAIDEALRFLPLAVSGEWQRAMNQLHSFKG